MVLAHGTWPHAIVAAGVRRAGLPLVFWAHGPHDSRGWLDRFASWTPPDLVIANSRTTRADVARNLFSSAAINVIHCPVLPPQLTTSSESREKVRAELEASPETVAIVTTCRLERWKGHDQLVEALGKMASVPNWRWWMVGGPQNPKQAEYLQELKDRVNELGIAERVRFLGQRSDVPRLLAAADIHCQPNNEPEPFGIAFIEALYAGLPVVTSALGGALEIVDESCGILVPPKNAVRLGEALERLIEDPLFRLQLGSRGPLRASEVCDPATQLGTLQKILRSLRSNRDWEFKS